MSGRPVARYSDGLSTIIQPSPGIIAKIRIAGIAPNHLAPKTMDTTGSATKDIPNASGNTIVANIRVDSMNKRCNSSLSVFRRLNAE